MVAPGESPKPKIQPDEKEKEVPPQPDRPELPPPPPASPQRELEDWELPRKPGDGPRLPDPNVGQGWGA